MRFIKDKYILKSCPCVEYPQTSVLKVSQNLWGEFNCVRELVSVVRGGLWLFP